MNTTLKVLIIDDVLANIEILHKILQSQYEVFFAKSGAEGIAIARREMPDLILLDVMMPEMDGYQVCSALKQDPLTAPIPIIFITAMGTDEDETRGLESGAIDYITKPIVPAVVRARVRNHLELKRNRDLLKELSLQLGEKNRELEILAREDALTGVANRRYFNEVLDSEIKRAFRTRQPLSLLMCDIDHFKRYNDHYGHVAGDRCLRTIGQMMKGHFKRAGDLAARYGGEEFAAILPDTPPENAAQVGERLREEIMALALPHPESEAGVVTMSIGVAGGIVARDHDAERLVSRADRALYLSKEGGRNRLTSAQWQ